ncbi:MAG: carboxypeptidase-like regulatory domain-containing protein, partial [Polyangiales bacterium]
SSPACSFDSSSPVPTIQNSCAGDSECGSGICDGDICVDDSGRSVEVAIEVLRGASEMQTSIPASWALDPESHLGPGNRELVLPATRQVRGQVRWDGVPVPATLRFVRRMNGAVAQLTPVPVETDTLPEPVGGSGADAYDFSAVLVAGETYDVTVMPRSDMVMTPTNGAAPAIRSLPPLYRELSVEVGDVSIPRRFDVLYPIGLDAECSDDEPIGCTLEAEVASFDGELLLREAGLQVRAIEQGTERVVSSIAETDERGLFSIRLSRETPDYLIRITSSAGREPFPAVSVDPGVVFADDPIERQIEIPRLSSFQVTGEVRDSIGRRVPAATVRFISTGIFDMSQLGLEGTFSGTASSEGDGTFSLELLPGIYDVTVTPPEDSENNWGILSTEAPVVEGFSTSLSFVVPGQINLGGEVETFLGEPAPGLTILARARVSGDPGSVHRSQETVSDDMGGFRMSVDVGLYDMHVKVPQESGYAWLVEPELAMNLNRGDLARGYRLEPPIPVYGVVRNSAGDPVPNAIVRGYMVDSYDGGAARPLQVAETVSNEDGSYRLLIAPRLGDE